MTTDRQRRANRANAKSSTGPRSAAGKARAAQNALRHGLNVPIWSDPAVSPLAEAMARKIAGHDAADAETLDDARRIAEAQLDLNRARDSRRRLIAECLENPKYQPLRAIDEQLRLMKTVDRIDRFQGVPFSIDLIEQMAFPKPLAGYEKLNAIIEERAVQLAAIDRYERRALSRRKVAIRRYDARARQRSKGKSEG